MSQRDEKNEMIERALRFVGLDQTYSRRGFLKLGGITVVGLSALGALGAKQGKEAPLIIMDKAEGLVIGDPHEVRGLPALRTGVHGVQRRQGLAHPLPDQGGPEPPLRPQGHLHGEEGARELGRRPSYPGSLQAVPPPGALCDGLPPTMPSSPSRPSTPAWWTRRNASGARCARRPAPGR